MISINNNEIILQVPYCDKNEAKHLGAKWNSIKKYWFCFENSNNKIILLNKWGINTSPITFENEDRSFCGNDLFIDLIPSSCWFSNVRSCIHPKDWDRVRKYIYERVNYCCECCGINTIEDNTNGIIEAHERWYYIEISKIQKLMRIVALCHQCHQSTHMGLAGILGKTDEAVQHLKRVRNFTDTDYNTHKRESFDLFKKRSQINWKLDISLITNTGITVINSRINEKTKYSKEYSVCKKNELLYTKSSYDWKCNLCQSFNLQIKKHLHCLYCETDICINCYYNICRCENKNIQKSICTNINGHSIIKYIYDEIICEKIMNNALEEDNNNNISRYEKHRQEISYKGRYDESNLDLDYDSN
jgi:hypothetical protein